MTEFEEMWTFEPVAEGGWPATHRVYCPPVHDRSVGTWLSGIEAFAMELWHCDQAEKTLSHQ